jgi:hypothetical protein
MKIRNRIVASIIILVIMLLMVTFSVAQAANTSQEASPAFNLLEFLKTAGIIFVPLMSIVFGVVNYIGKWGVKGKLQLVSSLLSGLILGGIVMYFTILPSTAVAWFSVVLFGLLVGLAASGCYEGIKTASAKGSEGSGGIVEGPQ